MSAVVAGRAALVLPRRPLAWFVAIELVCVAGFFGFLVQGRGILASAFLAMPLQVLAWCALMRSGFAVLIWFTALMPLAVARLLPGAYEALVYFPGTIGVLVLLLLAQPLFGQPSHAVRLRAREFLPLAAFALWMTVSAVHATSKGWAGPFLWTTTWLGIQVVVLACLAAALLDSLREVRTLMHAAIASMAVVALCVPAFPSASGGVASFGGKFVRSPFGEIHLNVIAGGVAMVAAMALGMAAGAKRAAARLLLGVAVAACIVTLIVTQSRAAWLGFGVAFLYLLLKTRSAWLLVLAALVGFGIAGSQLLRALLVTRAHATTLHDPSLLGRFLLWDYAWFVAKANWFFGVGLENFRYVKHLYGFPSPLAAGFQYNAHNIYLEVLVDLGVVGLAGFLWAMAAAFGRAWRAVGTAQARDIGLGLSAGLVACAVDGLLESVMVLNAGVFAFTGFLFALAIAASRLVRSQAVGSVSGLGDRGPLGSPAAGARD